MVGSGGGLLVLVAALLCAGIAAAAAAPKTDDHPAPSPPHLSITTGSSPNASHLKYMSFYGSNPALMSGWVNILGLDEPDQGVSMKLAAWEKYRLPSFYGALPFSEVENCSDSRGEAIFEIASKTNGHRGKLCPNWEENLVRVVQRDVLPNLGPSKAFQAIFFGDEICCENTQCWETALAPVAKKTRALLGATHDVQPYHLCCCSVYSRVVLHESYPYWCVLIHRARCDHLYQ
jgi:hypothetical protein